MNIKGKIALYKLAQKDLDREIESQYIRFYRSNKNNDTFIFTLKPECKNEGDVVQELVEPITNTLMHTFQNYSGNFEFAVPSSDEIFRAIPNERVIPGMELPEKLKIRDIHSLYDLIKRNERDLERQTRIR